MDAINWLLYHDIIKENPVHRTIAAISVGVYKGEVVTDLDYAEDSNADTDMNVVMDDAGGLIEVQGTAEAEPFSRDVMNQLLNHAEKACGQLINIQKEALID